jgi:hypothetical protein
MILQKQYQQVNEINHTKYSMILQTIPQIHIKNFKINHTKYSMILQTIPTGKKQTNHTKYSMILQTIPQVPMKNLQNKSYQIFNDITNNTNR